MPQLVVFIVIMHELLLVVTDCNCTRTGSEVRTCTASLPCVRKKSRSIN